MPIVTFLHDLVGCVKGPYYRLVGRHTQRFLSRAAGKTKSEIQKKTLFIAAAGADDVIAEFCGVQRGAKGFGKNAAEKALTKKAVHNALRGYLSTLLILLGGQKEQLLKRLELEEAAWMRLWCEVFEYNEGDMARFNQILLPAYQQGGVEGLIKAACDAIANDLSPLTQRTGLIITETAVKAGLTKDVAAILKS